MEFLLIPVGVVLLYGGGELLVKGAVHLSRIYGLSPLVVGLTVVAFGTSMPELASSLIAVFRGSADIAIGNVIGSNSANIGLILGTAALIFPIAAKGRFLVRDMSVLAAVSILFPLVLLGNEVTRLQGMLLTSLLVPYLWMLLRERDSEEVEAEFAAEYGLPTSRLGVAAAMAIGGSILLVAGAAALVDGAAGIARSLGITERVIGISLVALGTSLPELATSVVAAMKREADIALGNVIGSNIFNILAVIGITASIKPFAVDTPAMAVDLIVMMTFTAVLLPFAMSGRRIARGEAVVLLIGYCAYIVHLFAG